MFALTTTHRRRTALGLAPWALLLGLLFATTTPAQAPTDGDTSTAAAGDQQAPASENQAPASENAPTGSESPSAPAAGADSGVAKEGETASPAAPVVTEAEAKAEDTPADKETAASKDEPPATAPDGADSSLEIGPANDSKPTNTAPDVDSGKEAKKGEDAEKSDAEKSESATSDSAKEGLKKGAKKSDSAKADGAEKEGEKKDVASETVETPDSASTSAKFLLNVLIAALVLGLPLLIGIYLSKKLKMPDHVLRISIVSFAVLASTAVTAMQWRQIKLGIDLKGGAILVYQIRNIEDRSRFDISELVRGVKNRIDPDGVMEVTVRPYGENEVEIIIPDVEQNELSRLQSKITKTGALEFRILATRRDHQEEIKLATENFPDSESEVFVEMPDGEKKLMAKWFPVHPREAERMLNNPGRYATRQVTRGGRTRTQVLVYMDDKFDVKGSHLKNAQASTNSSDGSPCVTFQFRGVGSSLFGGLTGTYRPKSDDFKYDLAIILDEEVRSAPSIDEKIEGNGQITGSFTEEETKDLADVLNAGKLPASLSPDPVSSLVTGPTLGQDTIKAGVLSMLVSTVAVIVFMLWYYRFAGIVANLALILNVVLIMAFMIWFRAAFTLSGLAGLALTVGMAVDANVLIYERMREEVGRGATLRMAIRNGFDRATVTIVDANVTTLITAVVLFVIGTDQVKGFAVTLILGILMNLFTAITCSRLMFDIAEKLRWIKSLKMKQMMANANFDFIGKRYPAIALSVVVIGLGLIGVVARGSGILDIDFTGGSSVEMVVNEAMDVGDVRATLAKTELPDITVQDVQSSIDSEKNRRFMINTSYKGDESIELPLDKQVEAKLAEAFPGKLAVVDLTFDRSAIVTKASADTSKKKDEAKKDEAKKDEAKSGDSAADKASDAKEDGAKSETSTVALKFSQTIDHDTLLGLFQEQLKKSGSSAAVALSNEEFEVGSTKGFTDWTLAMDGSADKAAETVEGVKATLAKSPYFPSSNAIGPSVAGNTQRTAAGAMAVSLALILAYVWFRFQQVSFGFAAVLAVIHDVLVALGALALSIWLAPFTGFLLVEEFKINLPIIAAFLTIIGYSLNDTIVIFDRIREVRGKSPNLTPELVNSCINQTLSRTILTSLTVFIVVLILYVFGGQGIHAFAFTLVVGVISGTYSTVYIATPVLIWTYRSGQTNRPALSAGTKALAGRA